MSDTNEIYQAVLEQCTKQIEIIKNEYGNQLSALIIEQISRTYQARLTSIENDNKRLKEEVMTLKERVNRMAISKSALTAPTTSSSSSNGDKINLNQINRYSCFEFAGWLYYANDKMGGFLYRVKTDGTGNQQLTDYSVCTMSSARVKDGKLFFKDKDYRERSIEL